MARISREKWSSFWRKGTVTTFTGRFQSSYDETIESFWKPIFQSAPDPAKIIDLGTGNGGIALSAIRFAESEDRRFHVVGVDSSAIRPLEDVKEPNARSYLSNIDFKANTPIEATGFPDETFDLAMSQFGVEYADPAGSSKEIYRVLKTQARFAAMMHRADSAIVLQARDGIAQLDACRASGLHEPVEALIRRLQRTRKRKIDPQRDQTAIKLREAVNERTNFLRARSRLHGDPAQIRFFTEETMAVFGSRTTGWDIKQKLRYLHSVRDETEHYGERMADLIAAALQPSAIEQFVGLLRQSGFEAIESAPFFSRSNCFRTRFPR